MSNQELAKIFSEIALYLEMEEVSFRSQAYEKVAIGLSGLSEDIKEIYKKGGFKVLEDLPGVGKNIAEKIEEYLKTGKIKYYENYKKKMPVAIGELVAVEGIGPKMVRDLWKYLKIRNVKELERAARAGKIRNLPNFGEKTEQNVIEGIEFLKRDRGRFLLGEILPKVREVRDSLKSLKEVDQISVAGSVRRKKETIGDVDLLITTKKPKKVMDFFTSLPGILKVWSKGVTKSSIRMREGFDIDLRVIAKKSFGSALQYSTGSKEHNIQTRLIAIEKNLKLNEYGIFRRKKMVGGWSEYGVYKILGFPWIPPELRENRGEIEVAKRGKLPRIIGYDDIKGDLHCHSKWNGGTDTIEGMAKIAQKMGYEYIGISDHTKFLRIEHGLDEKKLTLQGRQIERLNRKFEANNKKFRILQGCEANILGNGELDIKDKVLEKLDYVIAGIHSRFKLTERQMTERIIRVMKNPNVDIISHPTGRILKRRDEYKINLDKILKVAKETRTVLEINSFPERLDLNDINIKKAKEAGVKMVINTDSHHINQLKFIEFGVAQARRGWAEKEDIINSHSLPKMLKFLKP